VKTNTSIYCCQVPFHLYKEKQVIQTKKKYFLDIYLSLFEKIESADDIRKLTISTEDRSEEYKQLKHDFIQVNIRFEEVQKEYSQLISGFQSTERQTTSAQDYQNEIKSLKQKLNLLTRQVDEITSIAEKYELEIANMTGEIELKIEKISLLKSQIKKLNDMVDEKVFINLSNTFDIHFNCDIFFLFFIKGKRNRIERN